MTETDPPAIVAHDLVKRFGDRTVVDHLSFTVPSGSVTGFVGRNGAGKTTTLRLLLGLARADGGAGAVLGHPITDPARYLGRVGAMITGPAFHPALSARDNLRVLSRVGGLSDAAIDPILERVGLSGPGRDPVRTYSHGMKQRLGLAAALLPEPDLLVLDEPTNGLDPAGIAALRVLLRGLAAGGSTVFVSSHLLAEMEHLCDHLVVIDAGRRCYEGPLRDLSTAGRGVVVGPERATDCEVLRQLYEDCGFRVVALGSGSLMVLDAAAPAELNRLAGRAGVTLARLEAESPSLERAVLALTSPQGASR